jgi:microcystin-dependent protein
MSRWLKALAVLSLAFCGSYAHAERNGSGTYSVPNTAVSGSTISSSDYNENFSDMGTEMTNSLPRDGQAGMSGQFKAAVGTVGAPGMSFLGDLDMGFYRIGADNLGVALAGAKVLDIATTGMTVTGNLTVTGSITGTVAVDSSVPPGAIMPYAGTAAPTGFLLMHGQCVSRVTYADLYSAIGTTYDNGCSGTEFGIPDLRGRAIAGQDDMGGSSANRLTGLTNGVDGDTLGASGGLESFTLATANLPSHTHGAGSYSVGTGINEDNLAQGWGEQDGMSSGGGINNVMQNADEVDPRLDSGTVAGTSSSTGSGTAMGHIQPTLILNYIIKI